MLGTTLDGRYRIVRLIGQGGMGSVYEGTHAGTGRRVAVKVVDEALLARGEGAVSRFHREAKAAGSIASQHIAEVTDFGTDPTSGAPYLVMEYLEGEDLDCLLARVGHLPADLAVRIGVQAAVGLTKAHEARVVHRDIKPANLFLARREHGEIVVKLLDFGIAKLKPDPLQNAESKQLTQTGGLLGSPLYMSPEQARGAKAVDERSDVFSLGLVLFRCVVGHAPHEHIEGFGELIVALCTVPPPPLAEAAPWVPAPLAQVVDRALAFRAADRFPTAAALRDALLALAPEGFALRQETLAALAPAATRRLAPRAAPSTAADTHPAPPTPISTLETARTLAPAEEKSAGIPPEPTASPGAVEASTLESAAPPPRRPRRWALPAAALGTALALGFAVLWGGPSEQATEAARPASPETPGSVASSLLTAERRVSVVIRPAGATVELDGASTPVVDGAITVVGRLGSTHRVRILAGSDERSADVVIAEEGPVPALLTLEIKPSEGAAPRSSGSAAAALGAGTAPTTKTAASPPKAPPASPPRPTSDPLIRGDFE